MFTQATRGLLTCLIAAACASAFPNLVPSRRSDTLLKREPCAKDLAPKSTAALHYAIAPHHPATAVVTFTAHHDRPIILLEDLDHLVDEFSCTGGLADDERVIRARFASDEAYALAHEAWSALEEFVVVTSHAGCNAHGERGAWRASGVHLDPSLSTITLDVEEITMREVGQSFGVRYDSANAVDWAVARHHVKRTSYGLNENYNSVWTPGLGERFPLFPPNASIAGDVSQSIVQELTDAEIDLTCVGCGLKSNLSVGLDIEVGIGSTTCPACATLTTAGLNFTVNELSLTTALEVFLGKEVTAGTSYPVLNIPIGPGLHVPNLIDIGPSVGLVITFNLDISASINFTYGATASIATGAVAAVNLIDSTGKFNPSVLATGWDQSGIQQIPLRLNDGELNITASVALAPFAEVGLTVLGVGATLRLTTNMPELDVTAMLRSNVNRQCNSVGDNDFEFFGGAFLVGADLDISATASFDVDDSLFSDQGIPNHWDRQLFNHDFPLLPTSGRNSSSCFIVSNDQPGDEEATEPSQSSSVPSGTASATQPNSASVTPSSSGSPVSTTFLPGVPASTGTLYPAASAVPTWNFTKIESYYSASSQLPTNVNYTQMVQATTVPDNLKPAVSNSVKPGPKKKGDAVLQAKVTWQFLLFSTVLVALSCM